jgi:hypothetical protein
MAVSIVTFVVLTSACLFAAAGVGFIFLEKYVRHEVRLSERIGSLELVGVPRWLNEPLKQKVFAAAMGGGYDLRLDEDAARRVCDDLVRNVAWLNNVKVQVTHDKVRVEADWRKPLALVKRGLRKFYLDLDLVVLDYVEMPELAIVQIKGLAATPKAPVAGGVWLREDVSAAVAILDRLDRMDDRIGSDKRLLSEIKSIDVSNYDGLQNSRAPHIILYAKDNTEIIWGAEYGKWQQHLECTDTQKLAKLYQHYKEYGTLLDRARYINLRDPQNEIPLPIDKY